MKTWWMVVAVGLVLTAPVWGQNPIFHDGFESGDTSGWWAPARIGKTGQTTCFNEAGAVIPCAGTGQNGNLQSGVAWPNPRFYDTGNGTVTDTLTGLTWLKNANCFGTSTWLNALTDANTLASGTCGLTDGSAAGEWRLPNLNELQSLIDYEYYNPALSNAAGNGQWTQSDAFSGVQSANYWSSTSYVFIPQNAWNVGLQFGQAHYNAKTTAFYLWPVRGGEACLTGLVVEPSLLDFGTVEVGNIDTGSVTVVNTCAMDINMTAETDQQYFDVFPAFQVLSPEELVILTVQFAPTDGAVIPPDTSALISGNLNVGANDLSGIVTQVSLTGIAYASPEIHTNPYGHGGLWSFPTTTAGDCSPIDALSELIISNTGSAILSLSSVVVTGPYVIASAPSTTIHPGENTTAIMRFCPVVDNNSLQPGQLTITSNDPSDPVITIDLEGQEQP